MPLRSVHFPAFRLHQVSLFHSTATRRDPSQNHYETLQIPIDASAKDIKKQFYSLSKTHHPDRNPNDPDASERFVKISEAYTILGTPEKRQQYDREFLRHNHSGHGQGHGSAHPRGSFHSSGPAGGRPPSGLSRRRTQFRGPPPSFYRSGGWGEHSEKRRAAQDNGAPGAERPREGEQGTMGGGMGPGQSPFGFGDDVPHFDREGHMRTHENIQGQRNRRRMSENFIPEGGPPSLFANFLLISGILFLGVLVPTWMLERFNRSPKNERRVT